MSTNGSIGVVLNSKLFATYNHWDSYPDSLGIDVVEFCKKLNNDQINVFKKNFSDIKVVSLNKKASKKDQEKYIKAGFFNNSVDDGNPSNWYCLLREIQGAKYFEEILNGTCSHWIDFLDFMKNSSCCEYAYIINLDDMTLNFYEGSNKELDINSNLPFEQEPDSMGYYPVRFKGSVNINEIPDNWMEKFYPNKVETC